MKTSAAGLALIKNEEGLARVIASLIFPHTDCSGVTTIGYGHIVTPDDNYQGGTTMQEVELLFFEDIFIAETLVSAALELTTTVAVHQDTFDALVDVCFNIGDVTQGIQLVRAVRFGDREGAEVVLVGWIQRTRRPCALLKARRVLALWGRNE